jgi:NAD(P)H-hydrate epimerase
VVVDALLGTGFTGVLRPPYAGLVDLMNAGPAVLAIDIPTGVEADTGAVNSTAVNAAMTVTYIGRKIGLFTGAGVAAAGEVVFADLGVGAEILRTVMGIPLLSYPAVTSTYPLPVRDANAYKQRIGHVAVIGGDHSMGGAPLMAAEAALRVGAGLVTVVTRAEHRGAILSRRPEIMVVDADDERRRGEILEKAATLVVGPGLGREAWGMNLLEEALRVTSPVVLDADGLNGFASGNLEASGPVVVTPHVGEAAALLGAGSHEIAADRPGAALRLASKVRGVSVLKGAGSVVAHHGSTGARVLGICAHGNPGMASAGMGDVLAGVIGGLLAQGLSTAAAAAVGVTLHSRAADVAAEHIGQRSLLATDLIPAMIELLAGC